MVCGRVASTAGNVERLLAQSSASGMQRIRRRTATRINDLLQAIRVGGSYRLCANRNRSAAEQKCCQKSCHFGRKTWQKHATLASGIFCNILN